MKMYNSTSQSSDLMCLRSNIVVDVGKFTLKNIFSSTSSIFTVSLDIYNNLRCFYKTLSVFLPVVASFPSISSSVFQSFLRLQICSILLFQLLLLISQSSFIPISLTVLLNNRLPRVFVNSLLFYFISSNYCLLVIIDGAISFASNGFSSNSYFVSNLYLPSSYFVIEYYSIIHGLYYIFSINHSNILIVFGSQSCLLSLQIHPFNNFISPLILIVKSLIHQLTSFIKYSSPLGPKPSFKNTVFRRSTLVALS